MRGFVVLLCLGLGSTGIFMAAHAASENGRAPTRLGSPPGDSGDPIRFKTFSRAIATRANTVVADASMPAASQPVAYGPSDGTWNDPETALSVRAVQRLLNWLGFEAGPVDGVFGAQTRAAIMAYQESLGLEPTGEADTIFETRLRAEILRSRVIRPVASKAAAVREAPAEPAVAPMSPSAADQPAVQGATGPVCIAPASKTLPAPVRQPAVPDDFFQRAVWEFFTISRDIVLALIRAVDGESGDDAAHPAASAKTVVATAAPSATN